MKTERNFALPNLCRSQGRVQIWVANTLFAMLLMSFMTFTAAASACQQPVDEKPKTETELIVEEQKRMADRYKLLEEKLFTLYEYERDLNPIRSKILKRAYLQSQEKMTRMQFNTILEFLNDSDLKNAEDRQQLVLSDLKMLLKLLESEDRGKRVRDELKRHQEYLKEIDRLIRMQRGIRAQTEGGSDQKRLAKSQRMASERAADLANEIKKNEESQNDEDENEDADGSGSESPPSSEGSDKANDSDRDSSDEDSKSGEDKNDPDAGGENKADDNDADPQAAESSEPGENSEQSDSGQPGQSQNGQNGQGGSGGQGSESQSPPAEQANPIRKRIQAAEERMKQAQKKLEEANRSESTKEMEAAERELEAAKKELEEILRQLREEEVERTLAMLESRFRQMLEREIRVYEETRKLDSTPLNERNTEFEIRAGKVSLEQNSIASEASRAHMLLVEDASSVAFPETVDQLRQDMLQIAQRLSAAKTGRITIGIEEDVIETLEYLIEALVVTQQDMEKMKQSQSNQQQGGQPGDQPLVDQLAEIKMLKGLQERIYRRHKRYSNLLKNPDDVVGTTNDPDLQRALERLSQRQQQLTDIARDIVVGKNN